MKKIIFSLTAFIIGACSGVPDSLPSSGSSTKSSGAGLSSDPAGNAASAASQTDSASKNTTPDGDLGTSDGGGAGGNNDAWCAHGPGGRINVIEKTKAEAETCANTANSQGFYQGCDGPNTFVPLGDPMQTIRFKGRLETQISLNCWSLRALQSGTAEELFRQY